MDRRKGFGSGLGAVGSGGGFGSVGGRVSGIRPPTAYKANQGFGRTASRPSDTMSSTASTRKPALGLRQYAAPGSGGSRVSGVGLGVSRASNVFGARPFSARKSNVTAKLSLFGVTPNNKRPSFQLNTGSSINSTKRTSSIGGRSYFQENRPLSDVSYHRQCVTTLITFLTENNYPHPINKRLNSHPTVGDVTKILEFLFSMLAPNCKVSPLDVEMPKLLFSYEYPYPIKKSDLVSFTSGRALGSLLGMMEWTVDSINYIIKMDPKRLFARDIENEVDLQYELMCLCLDSISDNEDSPDNNLAIINNDLKHKLEQLVSKKYGTEQDFYRLQEEQEQLEMEIERLDHEIAGIKDLPSTIETYKSDIQGYEKYILEMQSHKAATQLTIDEIDKEITEKENILKQLLESKRALSEQVEAQQFGVEEAELAKERKQQIEDEIKQESNTIEEMKKAIRTTKLECSKYEDIVNKMYSDSTSFINAMGDLFNSPSMSGYIDNLKHIFSNDSWIELSISLESLKAEDTTEADIEELKKIFTNKVNELKIAIVEQLSSLQGSVTLTEQQKVSETDSQIEEIEKQVHNKEAELKSLMNAAENCRKEQMSQMDALQSEFDRNRQLLTEFEGNLKRSSKEVKENIRDLRKQVQDAELMYAKEKTEIISQWNKIIAQNKEGINGLLTKTAQMAETAATTNRQLKEIALKQGPSRKSRKAKPGESVI